MSTVTEEIAPIVPDDFLRGQKDCKEGVTHRAGQSESYDRGYAAQYQAEQVKSEWSRA